MVLRVRRVAVEAGSQEACPHAYVSTATGMAAFITGSATLPHWQWQVMKNVRRGG